LFTIYDAISAAAAQLEASAVSEPRKTAGVLLCHVLGIDRTRLFTRSNEPITEPALEELRRLIDRRSAGEPLQYITGHQEFYGLDFFVSPEVLIPRPETELLVERILELARTIDNPHPVIVDIGTGSGCIGVSVAAHLPGSRVIATDVSSSALKVATKNASANGVSLEFRQGNLFEALEGLEHSVDILASNPPYVNEGCPEMIQREVRDWEPVIALFAGPDGLNFYRRLLERASEFIKSGGFFALEIGYSQLEKITALIDESQWELVDVKCDLQGIPRIITCRTRQRNSRAFA